MRIRLNSNIVYVVIALAFVGGMFSLVAAQSIPTITLSGNTHTTGDADIDGDLNVDGSINGFSISDHEARIAALEASSAIIEPMVQAHDPMLASHDSMLTTHDTILSDHDARITTNEADIATLEEGGGGSEVVCDTDGSGGIDNVEMHTHYVDNGILGYDELDVQGQINTSEENILSPQENGILDTTAEINEHNGGYNIPLGIPLCPLE